MDDSFYWVRVGVDVALFAGFLTILTWLARAGEYDVFISYRREGGAAIARAIEAALANSGLRVFLDVSSLTGGSFPAQLAKRIGSISNFFLILSPNALDRCIEADDWLRQEITQAFQSDRRLVPIEVPGFTFPPAMPEPLSKLPTLQRFTYDHELFEATIRKLRHAIGGYLWRKRVLRLGEYILAFTSMAVLGLIGIFANAGLYEFLVSPRESWVRVDVKDSEGKRIAGEWKDIFWITGPTGQHKGWLGGIASGPGGWPGAPPELGRGILLYTDNIRDSWLDVTEAVDVELRRPSSTNVSHPVRVGPITALEFLHSHFFEAQPKALLVHGVMATYTGLYRVSYGTGSYLADRQHWKRFDPLSRDRVFFEGLGFIGYEIYAIGWPGILHWSRGNEWRHEKRVDDDYELRSVVTFGPPDEREVWAVGRAGVDPSGGRRSASHGAIYHLTDVANGTWESIPLPKGVFAPRQTLADIVMIDDNTLVAVGEAGIVLRGTRTGKGTAWQWERIELRVPVRDDLTSMAYLRDVDAVFAVGSRGTILKATGNGSCWKRLETIAPTVAGGNDNRLSRIRFFGSRSGWIVGPDTVLQYLQTPSVFAPLANLPIARPQYCENVARS